MKRILSPRPHQLAPAADFWLFDPFTVFCGLFTSFLIFINSAIRMTSLLPDHFGFPCFVKTMSFLYLFLNVSSTRQRLHDSPGIWEWSNAAIAFTKIFEMLAIWTGANGLLFQWMTWNYIFLLLLLWLRLLVLKTTFKILKKLIFYQFLLNLVFHIFY